MPVHGLKKLIPIHFSAISHNKIVFYRMVLSNKYLRESSLNDRPQKMNSQIARIMGPTWGPTGSHVGPIHLAIRVMIQYAQWANGGGGLQSPTSQHGGHQNRRTRQGLVWCIIIITHSHKCTHRLIWVGGTVCQEIAIYKALILSHGHFVFSAGGGGLNAVRWRTRYVWVSEVEDCNFRCTHR